jgi:hypothetical protein
MIEYIKRSDIDVAAYDRCLKNSMNSRIYAYSWYLDIVAGNWDVLVYGDYEVVMPLPWRSKYFIKYIYPPSWTQQLGVFSSKEINEVLVRKFIEHIPKKFRKVTIQFNSGNPISGNNIEERVNYVLRLNRSYDDLFAGYNKNRKRVVNKSNRFNISINKDIGVESFLEFYLGMEKSYKINSSQIHVLNRVLNSGIVKVNIWGVEINGKLISAFAWLKDEKRITYLLPIANSEAKRMGLPTILVDELINEYSDCDLILDMEGSMIQGVALFYKSFGSEIEEFNLYQKSLF